MTDVPSGRGPEDVASGSSPENVASGAGPEDVASGFSRKINVVAAVITDGERFLVTRRPDGVHLAGLWEFPGGKVDQGEAHDAALRREIREELDADVTVDDLLLETTHTYPDRAVTLFFYRCRLLSTATPMLGQAVRWVTRAELPTLGFPPADDELIAMLVSGPAKAGPHDLPQS